jgi:hypothetical protein
MDEAEPQISITLAQQSMLVVQCFAKIAYAVDKVLATFAIMMNMDLDIGYPIANHFRKGFH